MSVRAGWIVAVAVMAAIGIVCFGGLRTHRAMASAKRAAAPLPATALAARQSARLRASLETLPLAFEANQGQSDPQVKYMARGNGYTVFLTGNDTVFELQSASRTAASRGTPNMGLPVPARKALPAAQHARTAAIHMRLVGANPQSQIAAGDELPGRSNYFFGKDRRKWHTNVPQFARISYRDAYPGVSMAFYGVRKQLEFDFIVTPGASADPIRFDISGAVRIATDPAGNLILASTAGDVLLHKPVAYQEKDGARQPVDARFVLQARNHVSFEVGNYDRSRELVIDPSVSYATYLGGTAEDDGYAIAVDSTGNAYVTGQTKSVDFPTKNALYGSNAGSFDVFVTKISSDGSTLEYSTYVGGSGDDSGNAIAIDGSGNVFVSGGTSSLNFPTTTGSAQKTLGGALDAFVFELSSSGGSLTYCTYLGGSGDDVANGIALAGDGSGDTFIVGSTASTNFHTTPSAVQSTFIPTHDGFMTKLNSSGTTILYSTYLGGSALDFASAVAVDSSNNAYVTGGTANPTFPNTNSTSPVVQSKCGTDGTCNGGLPDAFVSVIKADGSGFVYSTFLGGSGPDQGLGIAVDHASGNAYVTGATASNTDFPTKAAAQAQFGGGIEDAFVAALNPTGSTLLYSTYLGGGQADAGAGIAIDTNKNAYVTGQTASSDFKMVSATQGTLGGPTDAFVSEFNSAGSLVFSTYLGGSLNEDTQSLGGIAVDSAGANVYVTGNTTSTNFPTVAAEQNKAGGTGDAFVAKISLSGTTTANFTVTNGALSATSGNPGVSATATITVTSVNSFSSAVALACTVAPVVSKVPTCGLSPSSVTPAPNATATSTLTVSTTAASAMLERPAGRRSSGVFYALLMPIVGITFVGAGFGANGSRHKKLFGFLMLGLMLAGLLLMPACGGSNNNGGGGNTGTPAGTYTITVTGTSGGATATGSPALTLTVN
jgi:hypothetical protein